VKQAASKALLSGFLAWLATCFHAGILLGLFDPEDGGDVFLWNIC
jgi:hypothetical protein